MFKYLTVDANQITGCKDHLLIVWFQHNPMPYQLCSCEDISLPMTSMHISNQLCRSFPSSSDHSLGIFLQTSTEEEMNGVSPRYESCYSSLRLNNDNPF